MRILFLTTELPYPPKSGGLIKSWKLVEHWSQKHELRLIHLQKSVENRYIHELQRKLELKGHYYVALSRGRSFWNLLRSYVQSDTLNVFRNSSRQIRNKVIEWSKDVDLIFVDHYEMGQYIPESFHGKIVLHEHNAEFQMWKRLAKIESNPFKRWMILLESLRIRITEKNYANRCDIVLAAPNDIQELIAIGVNKNKLKMTYHLGEDFMLDYPDIQFEQTEKQLLFIGTLTWEANVDGLLWFIEGCWDTIKLRNPDVKFTIIGKNPDARLIKEVKKHEGIYLLGYIEDLENAYAESRVSVVPLRFGSGIKVKLLNAMYRGSPIVTTSIGIEGLDVTKGEDLLVADDHEVLASLIHELLNDKELWTRLRDASRVKASNYTWSTLLKEHDNVIESLISKNI